MEYVKLGDVCLLKAGKFVSAKDIINTYTEKTFPCYGGNGIRGYVKQYSHDGVYPIIGRQGALCGNVNYARGKFYATEHAVVVNPLIDMDKRWLYYALIGLDLGRFATGAAQPGLSVSKISEVMLGLPPIAEQRCIAATLDKVSALMDKRRQQLDTLDTLVKSQFIEMFSPYITDDNSAPLKELSDMVTVGIANSATYAYSDDGVIMFRNQNIHENCLDSSDLIHIAPEFAAKYNTKQLKKDDILVIRTGYPGIACLVPEEYEGCQTFTTLIARISKESPVVPEFVCRYINSEYGKRYVTNNQAGCAQQNFGATALGKMPVPIPPIDTQLRFTEIATQADKSKFVQ